MLAELAVTNALFDQRDHFIGVQASLPVRGDIAQLAAANHVADLPLLDAHDPGNGHRSERQAPHLDRHAIDNHVGHA